MACGEKYATLPASTQCGPMKLMSLEEAQARSLSPNHPAMRERQRENSLPDTSTAEMYHTVIDLSDSRCDLCKPTNTQYLIQYCLTQKTTYLKHFSFYKIFTIEHFHYSVKHSLTFSQYRRKFSGKSKKWKSIFSLGRSVIDSKGKLSRNGSVFMRAQNPSGKRETQTEKERNFLVSRNTSSQKGKTQMRRCSQK